MQKPPFCTPKTILLWRKNHTFAWRICNIQITNTLRTFRECILNGLRMRGEYVYAGAINRPLRLLTTCQFAANGLRMRGEQIANTQQTTCKKHKKHKKQPKHNARTRPLQHHIYINYIIYLHIFAYLK